MRMVGSLVSSVVVAALLLAGCSLFTDLEGFTSPRGGSTASNDAQAEVGSVPSTLQDASLDSGPSLGPNLLIDGDFEGTGETCGSWSSFRGHEASDTVARSGSASCRVCGDETTGGFTVDPLGSGVANALPGETYRAEAWVRTAPGQPVSGSIAIVHRIYDGDEEKDVVYSFRVEPSGDWQRIELTHTARVAGRIEVYIQAVASAAGQCFLVDDVTLNRVL